MKLLRLLALLALAGLTQTSIRAQLSNTGFETAGPGGIFTAAGWTQYGAVNREAWANHGGTYGMAFEWWVGPSGGFFQVLPATPGAIYTLKAWCLDDIASVTNGAYAMELDYFDDSTNLIRSDTTNITRLLNNVWQQLSLVGAPCPSNCATIRVLFLGSILVNDNVLKIDDISLTSSVPPTNTDRNTGRKVASGAAMKNDLRDRRAFGPGQRVESWNFAECRSRLFGPINIRYSPGSTPHDMSARRNARSFSVMVNETSRLSPALSATF